MALPDRFIEQASPAAQIAEAGLDAKAIVRTALGVLASVAVEAVSR
jgi:hypothetical protein